MNGKGFSATTVHVGATIAVTALLAACGGGGGGGLVQSPSPAGGSGVGFTPTVANDASLTQVNPPTVPTQAAAVVLASNSLNRHLIMTNAAGALGAGLTGQGVTIGFVDSGVNRNHPTLAGRVARNFVHVDPATNNTSVDDVVGHGTVVASLAAGRPAVGNYVNADGSNTGQTDTWGGGIAQGASVVSSRIINDERPTDDGSGAGNEIRAGQGYGDFFKSINAELANAGAKIINNSWGGLYWNDAALSIELANAWKDFVAGRGGIVVFANGNSGDDPRYAANPSDNAALPTLAGDAQLEKGWLTVAALDPANPARLTSYSQQCGIAMNYCLAAPGNVVYIDPQATSQAGSGLYQGGGTSYAAPQVSGAAAVVWSAFPYFSNDQVRQAILGGAKDLGDPGVDPVFGWGLLDVSKAANGPSTFAWGDFSVSFSGNSVWRNQIFGNGGLVKSGSGILTLTERGAYRGDTRLEAGGLYLQAGAGSSNVYVAKGATLWSGGPIQQVSNGGTFIVTATGSVITRSFTQDAGGNFGVWLGNPLTVAGPASLDGQLSILGVKSGYTTTAKEALIKANSISGTFSSLKAAPNVFLDASLSYDPNNVFLDIKRIDVSKAVAGMGLPGVTLASSVRVEAAMRAIDGQLSLGGSGIGAGFIEGAGALQRIASIAQADRAIRSLSGELHAAADAAGIDTIEAGRRALSSRFGELAGQSQPSGDWYRAQGQPGQGGSAFGRFRNDGWLMGSDQRLGATAVAGFAFGVTDVDGVLGNGYDRSHERQTQARFYLGGLRGKAYALGQFGIGRYQRQLHRTLWWGDRVDGVATEYAGNFTTVNIEFGRRFDGAGMSLVPYAGIDHVRLDRDGFVEHGAAGFGLKANAGSAERTSAVAGVRAERAWTTGSGTRLALRGYAEWQHAGSESGLWAQASFVGADSWSPLYGEGFARTSGLFGLGLDALLSPRAALSFGYDRRAGAAFADRQWSAKLRYGF